MIDKKNQAVQAWSFLSIFILFENLFKPRQLRLAVLKYYLWLAS